MMRRVSYTSDAFILSVGGTLAALALVMGVVAHQLRDPV